MAEVPKELRSQFKETFPNVPDEVITEAAKAAGQVNGGMEQLQGLVTREVCENLGANNNALIKLQEYFGGQAQNWLNRYLDQERGR